MFPIRDHNPSRSVGHVTYGLIAANVLVFLAMLPSYGDDRVLAGLFQTWGLVATDPAGPGLVTHMFLHGGFMHILGNMLFLHIFGDNMEEQMGPLRFLGFYLLCGLAAAGAQIASAPQSPVPMVGASGAVAGVMGGYLLMFPRARVDVLLIIVILIRIITVPAWALLGLWFAIEFFNSTTTDAALSGVAHWAHTGGFVAGVVLTLPLFLRRGGPAFWRRTRGLPPHAPAHWGRSSLPRVGRTRPTAPPPAGARDTSPWGSPRPPAQRSRIPQVPRRR